MSATAKPQRKLILTRETIQRLDPHSISCSNSHAPTNTQCRNSCNWQGDQRSAPQTQAAPSCAPAAPTPEQPREQEPPPPPPPR